jgi:hypothetical protein
MEELTVEIEIGDIKVIIVEPEWLNIEVLRSNLGCIGQDRETKLLKEGKEAIALVKQIVEHQLDVHKRTKSDHRALQPIKFMILSNKLIDMTGYELMLSVRSYFKEQAITNEGLKQPLYYF